MALQQVALGAGGWFDAFATRYAAEINGFSSVP